MARELKFSKAICEAIDQSMALDSNVVCFGLGVTDPKRVFGTTEGLLEAHGPERVFDMPTSENAMTGIAIGASLSGIKPVMVHQRLDFFLLAIDQLVNNAAKWSYTFGGQNSASVTIRLILGQGWGQGPTHCQNLHSWFAHVPGLRVVMPTTPVDAKGLLISSIFDPNPVVFLEHRWLHNTTGEVPSQPYRIPLGKTRTLNAGGDITLVSSSYLTVEALHAVRYCSDHGISCELIDLRSISPIDWDSIYESVGRTRKLLVLDGAHASFSVSSEIVSRVCTRLFGELDSPPEKLTFPDYPSPTSSAFFNAYYPRAETIAQRIAGILGRELDTSELREARSGPDDVPGDWFTGPF